MVTIKIKEAFRCNGFLIDKYIFESGNFYFVKKPFLVSIVDVISNENVEIYKKTYVENFDVYDFRDKYKDVLLFDFFKEIGLELFIDEFMDSLSFEIEGVTKLSKIKELDYYQFKCLFILKMINDYDIIFTNIEAMAYVSCNRYYTYLRTLISQFADKTLILVYDDGGVSKESISYIDFFEIKKVDGQENLSKLIPGFPNYN
ncbi:hypothetical protein O2K51_11140 [Apibacter raozihei]|uniref:hypothetical protein n=1 Tax=Apibacter raozihei TaxID=2500547 RepID=UPI000FE3EBC8|nr:hypothetical protein [Apibacter raozihei]